MKFKTTRSHWQQNLLASVIVLTSGATLAETLDVDWLYLSGNGSWIARSESIIQERTNLRLPVKALSADQFWWQSETPNTQLSWSLPSDSTLPPLESVVEIIGTPGNWIIKEANASYLTLQHDSELRYWPQSQWHLLKVTDPMIEDVFELTVIQPLPAESELSYAWQEYGVSAQVRYRLDLDQAEPELIQELIVNNRTEYDLSSPGYSFSEIQHVPVMAMRTMAVEMDEMSISVPKASESQGIPTLVSDQPIQLTAGASVWLPVSTTELKRAEREYQFQWDTRQLGAQQAQSFLLLTAKESLPDLRGPLKIGVFDRQVAVLDTYYQPTTSEEARLSLGQSSLVGLESRLIDRDKWELSINNRSTENVSAELILSHWTGKTHQRTPMRMAIDAKSSKIIKVALQSDGMVTLIK